MSAGPGFNLSTKKEDVSTRLKAHNLKRAKDETKKLEHEGKKMEERLLELKLAMNREKEERERQGGGFWKSGQQGSLTTYAEEVLARKKSKSAPTKGKIKILKDKPLDLPERSAQPGTMAYIAQRGSHTPRDKPKGPKCGQCEDRSASVSCVQCAEDYCAGCFAAFHLKGNLKKHRSIPLAATPRQCFASPRPNPPSTNGSYDFQQGDGAVLPYAASPRKDRNSPDGASGSYDNPLLHGSYDEAEQAASFQQALEAWRTGKAAGNASGNVGSRGGSRPGTDRTDRSQRRSVVRYSPAPTPTFNVETSTGTLDKQQEIDIKFNTSSMTYAERLLLKKHRRTDVEALFTPRDEDKQMSSRGTSRETPRQSARERTLRVEGQRGPQRETSNLSIKIEEFNDADFDEGERVDFDALYHAIHPEGSHSNVDPDAVSIVEVQDNDVDVEQTTAYKIQEVGEMEAWSTEYEMKSTLKSSSNTKSQFEAKPPSTGRSTRRKSGRKSSGSSIEKTAPIGFVDEIANQKSGKANQNDPIILSSKLKDIENDIRQVSARGKINEKESLTEKVKIKPTSASSSNSSRRKPDLNLKETSENYEKVKLSSSKSTKSDMHTSETLDEKQKLISRQNSAKSRPQTGSRVTQSRTGSRQSSRPTSRITSRPGSSRAASRMETPGLLTKAPSEALSQVARMSQSGEPYRGLESFYMVGVELAQQQEERERTLTPSQHKSREEKIKVSYQLYNMAPRSWRPEMSLQEAVPVDRLENEEAEDDRSHSVMAYIAYSEKLVSDITDRLISRFGELPLDEDSLSDQSSGGAYRSLGEEYRTFTPRSHSHGSSVQNSPSMSGRGTPVHMLRSQAREPQSARKDSLPTQKSLRDPEISQLDLPLSQRDPPVSQRGQASQRDKQSSKRDEPVSNRDLNRTSQNGPKLSQRGQSSTQSTQNDIDPKMRQSQNQALLSSRTPRVSGSRARTPGLHKSQGEVVTPRRSQTFHGEPERPVSRAIVMDGADLSVFDAVGEETTQNREDEETLDQLEWELASQSGRLTEDGKISRMEMPDDSEFSDDSISSLESFRSRSRLGQDQGYDINAKLRQDELEEDDDGTDDENDVKNLF
ncbi:zinc finger B-box domain-containing protein 1-like [Dreissena polymorpha]|nr:zinc finger B-box domain-containing protein 1-like [Dreissena polymorpha]XP_052216732.1 zinc finger B-box domain-containing protein 1-like [Dreissena polymorpha]XP_052216733.1 zinc finger B-box domain-containing protein 1-like [Dreissena polymorpha]